MKAVSWNVNGLRAMLKKGLAGILTEFNADIVCIQETKATQDQLPMGGTEFEGYHVYFASAERKGYSGVAVLTRAEPIAVSRSMGKAEFDSEGRLLILEYIDFTLLNVYFPNGGASDERLAYKLDFYEAFLELVHGLLSAGKRVVICGDVNTAHTEIDLARPQANIKTSGFLPEERDWVGRLLGSGMLDTYRHLNPDKVEYSWWDMKTGARARNVGWRIDYFFVSEALGPALRGASILGDVMGSDHCPVTLELDARLE